VLRHQLIVLKRRLHGRVRPTDQDRWFLIQLYRWFASILQVLTIVRPETLVRWHRAGFRRYWRRKSRRVGGVISSRAILGGLHHHYAPVQVFGTDSVPVERDERVP
jgi:hypothetical protein